MRLLVFICLFFTLTTVTLGQDKPPVAVDDTVYFPIAYYPYEDYFHIYPLSNDYSQEMHPIMIGSCSYVGGVGVAIVTDTTISLFRFQLDEDIVFSYRIRDLVSGLVSEPAYIHIIAKTDSRAWLDVNNINARINATSNHFSRYEYSSNYGFFECPKGSSLYTISNLKLWVVGVDSDDKLHLAPSFNMQYDHYHGYRPGPLSHVYNEIIDDPWNRVWDMRKSEIDHHRYNWQNSDYIIPESILNWPAHGDTLNGQLERMAPFEDIDQDGLYEPLQGDYPMIKGDQAVYFISNDDRGEHLGDTAFFGAEIHGMAYAYDCPQDSIYQNTLFIEYLFINRSDHTYNDVYMGVNTKLGIGSPFDDYSGCDTLLNAFYGYNALENDSNGFFSGYGVLPPAQAVTFLNQPLNYYKNYFRYPSSSLGQPSDVTNYYYQLKGLWNDGSPVTYGDIGYGGNLPVKFQYPGNPSVQSEWSMQSAHIDPNTLGKSIGSTGPFIMNPGDSISLELAILFARDYQGNNLSSVTLLLERLKKLRAYYLHDSIPCHETIDIIEINANDNNPIHIYPNPASTDVNIEYSLSDVNGIINIYDLTGKEMGEYIFPKGETQISINISSFPAGVYLVTLGDFKSRVGHSKLIVR